MDNFSADRKKLTDLVQDDSMGEAGCDTYEHRDMYWGSSFVWFFLIFIFTFIIIFLILYSTQPISICGEKDFSEDDHHEREWGKPLLWAFGIAFFVIVLIWVLYAISGKTSKDC